jgi:protein-S-isoprenylcysteine O-methyltransferase Ste14
MEQNNFKIIYFTGFVVMFGLRLYYRWLARDNRIVVNRKDSLEILLLALAFVGMAVIPLTYVFTSRLKFADYQLPSWAGWIGTAVFALALFLLWRSHAELGRNWSQSLELREGHRLVTRGVYKYVRHPMYAAFLLWGISQPLLLHNWLAGWSHLAAFAPLYFLRVPREEQMMLDEFGEEYRAYMSKTGRVIPRLNLSKEENNR